MLTGGTGTLGKAVVMHIVKQYQEIRGLSILSRGEVKQLKMMAEFPEERHKFINYVLGDIRDKERLTEAFKDHDVVINAAAIKHVAMAEKNPGECYKTNVTGTQNVIEACLENGIERALLVSTDKAIKPAGIYGESKKEAERLFLHERNSTRLSVVRFGNILGSRGSVIDVFQNQKASGKITITHSEATRFCILPNVAASFLVASLDKMKGGEVFMPAMKSFKVNDLADLLAPGCDRNYIGLRVGDKLHEEMNGISSNSGSLMSKYELKLLMEQLAHGT